MRRLPALILVVVVGLVAGMGGFLTAAMTREDVGAGVVEEEGPGGQVTDSGEVASEEPEDGEPAASGTEVEATSVPETRTSGEQDPTDASTGGTRDAPIDVSGGPVWISVASSLNAQDFGRADAVERHDTISGSTTEPSGVLLSDRYPSLNPNLWVVYLGPFVSEERAADACAGLSPCYPRILSDDADDRYCMAADGCVGERDTED